MTCRNASAKEVVIWRVTDWPPFYILSGQDIGNGLYDNIIKLLADAMPEYEHKRVNMNTDRVLLEMSRGRNVCHPSVLPNTDATLSVVNSILLPHRIIINKSHPGIARLSNPISLDLLLANNWLKGGVTPRRYTEAINNIVEQHAFRDHLHNSPNYSTTIKNVLLGRLDYTIEYTPIISYTAKQLSITNNTTSLEVLETKNNPFLLVHIACPKNNWGEMMIAKINKILIAESKKEDFLTFRIQWYDEKDQQLLKLYYEQNYFIDK
ncbi:MAG: hypothetical protein GY787_33530 [Alteromonadales bacterium]|nr:hypothetical protein [Alteromonadales bacterium]